MANNIVLVSQSNTVTSSALLVAAAALQKQAMRDFLLFWNTTAAFGIKSKEAHHFLALKTCNGCGGKKGNDPGFLQVHNRIANETAQLSVFLSGTTFSVPDNTT